MQSKYIGLSQLRLHYYESEDRAKDQGSNGKNPLPTMVFLHGFPEFGGAWDKQFARLSDSFRCIAPDLPGYHLSDKPDSDAFYQVTNLIEVMAEFIAEINQGEPVYLVAHDWGGAIAWPLAAFHSDLIEKLIILNAAHPSTFTREMMTNTEQQRRSQYIHLLIADDAAETVARDNFAFLRGMLQESRFNGAFPESELSAYQLAWQQPGAVEGMLKYYAMMPQQAPRLEQGSELQGASPDLKIPQIFIKVPTLVVWGEQDKAFVTDVLTGLEHYVPALRIVRLQTASHWLHHEAPDEVCDAIRNFVTENNSHK